MADRGSHPRGQDKARGPVVGIGQHNQVSVAKSIERSRQLVGRSRAQIPGHGAGGRKQTNQCCQPQRCLCEDRIQAAATVDWRDAPVNLRD